MPSQAISWQLTPTLTPTQAQHEHKDRSVVRPNVHSLFIRSSDHLIVRLIVHGSFVHPFDRSFVQIIFVQSLCCRNSDRLFGRSFIIPIHRSSFVYMDYSPFIRSFIVTIHHSWFVHTNYSSFIVCSYRLFIVH
jgi:hypothetical protein